MKIDREQLALLLAERSGLDEEEVRSQLDTLMDRIRNAANEGKSFEIEEFGTFRMEEGELRFEPSRTLRTELNQKYAGMKPIELIGAYKEQHTEEDAPQDEEDVMTAGASPVEGSPSKNFELDTGQAAKASSGGEASPGDSDDAGEDESSRRSRIRKRAAKARREAAQRSGEEYGGPEEKLAAKKQVAADHKPEKKEEAGAASAPAAGKQATGSREKRHVKSSREKRSRDSLGRIAAAMVIVIAVAAAGLVAWNAGLFDSAGLDTGESVQAPAQPDDRPSLAQDEQAADTEEEEGGTSEEQTGNEIAGQTEQSGGEDVSTGEGETPSSGYGLEGELNASLSSYYTIVVHSLADSDAAESRADNLRQQGYRVTVRTATIGGTQYWRVGLGQFSGVSEAQEAADGLPEPYGSNHFIRNIQ